MTNESIELRLTSERMRALVGIAEFTGSSLVELVHDAVEAHLASFDRRRERSLAQLFDLDAPVADWNAMKREIQMGALGTNRR